jgi:transcriptional regulator with PAS, ATPase and Fis domain
MSDKYKLVGQSKPMQQLRERIRKVAPSNTTILIQGESGTGKESAAREIHRESRRSNGPFVALNAAAIPDPLVESELFGYEKGAFTGAANASKGKFREADKGTMFLDEVGEISMQHQVKLLRVIEEREVQPLGGGRPIPVDFRLVAATNKDLKRMSEDGGFREDLYYRVNVGSIRMPALRERLEDIPELAHHIALLYSQFGDRRVHRVSREVLDLFRGYHWPGNVRELVNVIQRAILAGESETIEVGDIPEDFIEKTALVSFPVEAYTGGYEETMRQTSRRLIGWALSRAQGNCSKAASLLGLKRSTFYSLALKHGISGLNQT